MKMFRRFWLQRFFRHRILWETFHHFDSVMRAWDHSSGQEPSF